MQLATLGTVIAGLNVVFGQMFLDINKKPNLKVLNDVPDLGPPALPDFLPGVGLERHGRDLTRQNELDSYRYSH